MTDLISPQTLARIEALLSEIASGQHIDVDTIEELRAHMEEKLLDYMHGAVRVSEEDAFVLVREHFGKPEVIRACFEEHRERVTPLLFFRWFSAAAISSAVFMIILTILPVMMQTIGQAEIAQFIISLLMIAPLWFWRVQEEKGIKVWYLSLHPGLLLSLVFMLAFAVPTAIHFTEFEMELHRVGNYPVYPPTGIIMYLLVFILWWFDRRPRYVLLPLGVAAMIAFFSAVWSVEYLIFAPMYGLSDMYKLFWLALITIMLIAAPVYLLVTAVFAWGRNLKLAIER